jgi:hypothetical protein
VVAAAGRLTQLWTTQKTTRTAKPDPPTQVRRRPLNDYRMTAHPRAEIPRLRPSAKSATVTHPMPRSEMAEEEAEREREREAMVQRRRIPDRATVGGAGDITRDVIAPTVGIAPTARIAAANGSIETAGDTGDIAAADGAVVVRPAEEGAPRVAPPLSPAAINRRRPLLSSSRRWATPKGGSIHLAMAASFAERAPAISPNREMPGWRRRSLGKRGSERAIMCTR